jgi:hypothetical protein
MWAAVLDAAVARALGRAPAAAPPRPWPAGIRAARPSSARRCGGSCGGGARPVLRCTRQGSRRVRGVGPQEAARQSQGRALPLAVRARVGPPGRPCARGGWRRPAPARVAPSRRRRGTRRGAGRGGGGAVGPPPLRLQGRCLAAAAGPAARAHGRARGPAPVGFRRQAPPPPFARACWSVALQGKGSRRDGAAPWLVGGPYAAPCAAQAVALVPPRAAMWAVRCHGRALARAAGLTCVSGPRARGGGRAATGLRALRRACCPPRRGGARPPAACVPRTGSWSPSGPVHPLCGRRGAQPCPRWWGSAPRLGARARGGPVGDGAGAAPAAPARPRRRAPPRSGPRAAGLPWLGANSCNVASNAACCSASGRGAPAAGRCDGGRRLCEESHRCYTIVLVGVRWDRRQSELFARDLRCQIG